MGTYYVTGFNEKSKFDYFIRINYPNLKDAYYGYKSRKINRDEFKNIFNAPEMENNLRKILNWVAQSGFTVSETKHEKSC